MTVSDGAGPYSIGHSEFPGLSKLVEEMGELGQVLGKILGAGGLTHWDGDLRMPLHEEIADVFAALRFFCAANDLNHEGISIRTADKYDRFSEWSEGAGSAIPDSRYFLWRPESRSTYT